MALKRGPVAKKQDKSRRSAQAGKNDQTPGRPRPAPELIRRALTACFLGWVIPGAGHWYLGKRGRASVFLTVVALLLVLGVLMDGQIYRAKKEQPLTLLASFASMGSGPVHFVLGQSGWTSKGRGDNRSPFYEFGNTFIIVAGLLNMLIILDAYDVGAGYKP
jgi:hypothetical protein